MAGSVPTTWQGDVIFVGMVYFAKGAQLPEICVFDANVSPLANISAAKLQQQPQPVYAQPSAATAVAETKVVHRFRAVGTIEGFEAGNVVACIGDSTITFDLLKNGVSVLSAPIVVTNALAARATLAAVITDPEAEPNDVLEVAVTISAGTGTLGKGAFADTTVRAAAQ